MRITSQRITISMLRQKSFLMALPQQVPQQAPQQAPQQVLSQKNENIKGLK